MVSSALSKERSLDGTDSPVLAVSRDDGFFEFDKEQCKIAGRALAERYAGADPFPHIVMDNFIESSVLRQVVAEFPTPRKGRFDDAQSQLKTGYNLSTVRSAYINDLLTALNSAAFLGFLEQLTGIKGLISDSRFVGGGLHETRRGGHLSIHADFNIHPHTKLQRRLNLILFLNEGWDPEWGGALELWDKQMSERRVAAMPELGRAVIFNTDSNSFHGHPEPLNTPEHLTRRSIALYYYTAPPAFVLPRTTVFRARPGSRDTKTTLVSQLSHSLRLAFGKGER